MISPVEVLASFIAWMIFGIASWSLSGYLFNNKKGDK